MNRRRFLKTGLRSLIGAGLTLPLALQAAASPEQGPPRGDHLRGYRFRMRHFNTAQPGDLRLGADRMNLLRSSVKRLSRVQSLVGFGKFYLISFDQALSCARQSINIGAFSPAEIDFLEEIFYRDAMLYGFYGPKVFPDLTAPVPSDEIRHIPGTGNFLYRGPAYETYARVRSAIGPKVILTSGVRSVVKQFLLFLNKVASSGGNFSLASRSMAPPGYSYHAVGDFDVGQVGLGRDNFTDRFTHTQVYGRLQELGYIELRYGPENLLGVRFEPWHIKISPLV